MLTLSAQVLGDQRTVSAEQDALGITVTTSRGLPHARNLNDALRLARDDLGEFLRRGERAGVPWGSASESRASRRTTATCASAIARAGAGWAPVHRTRRPDSPPLAPEWLMFGAGFRCTSGIP
jgi:hypothetical protein